MNSLQVIEPGVAEQEAEFQSLVDAMVAQYPTIDSKGFDLAKVKGRINRKSAKAVVLHLTLSGWSLGDIATALSVKPQTVENILAGAVQEAAPLDDVELLRDLELQRLNRWERMCNECIERGMKPKVTKTIPSEDGSSERIEDQVGGPAPYMRLLVDISKRRSALLGMDKPTKVSVDKVSRQLILHEVVVSSPEQVSAARIAGLIK